MNAQQINDPSLPENNGDFDKTRLFIKQLADIKGISFKHATRLAKQAVKKFYSDIKGSK